MPDLGREQLDLAYRRYFPIVRAKCTRMLGDTAEAEDVAQETFVRLWKADVVRAGPAAVAAWVYRTSTRIAVDRLRHRAVVSRFARDADPVDVHPDEALDARSLLARLARTVGEPCLAAAILHRLDGLTHRQVGDVLAMSERTVRRLLVAFDAAATLEVKS